MAKNAEKGIQNIEITSGLDSKTTIIWDSIIDNPQNPPTVSGLFIIRLE